MGETHMTRATTATNVALGAEGELTPVGLRCEYRENPAGIDESTPPLLVAGGAGTPLLAGKRYQHLVAAVGAAHPREALVQVAAAEIRLDPAPDDRAPELCRNKTG
jgi:hypothetical protein